MRDERSTASATETGMDDLPSWNLDDLYPGMESPELERDFQWLETACTSFTETYQGNVRSLDAAGLLNCILEYERLDLKTGRIMSFSKLLQAENTVDPQRAKFANDCEERIVELRRPHVFFTLEINDIDDSQMSAMLAESGELARFEHFLKRIRKMRPHQLSSEMENLLSDLSVVGASAWSRLFDETVAGMTFELDGDQLGLAETLDRQSDHDRSVRERSTRALAEGFGPKLPLFSLITNTIAKEKEIFDRWRHFESPQAARHLANDIEPQVVALAQGCRCRGILKDLAPLLRS